MSTGKMQYFARFCIGLANYLLDILLKPLPRNKRKWVFGATGGFRDNPKYLFYQTVNSHKEVRAIWIGRNKKDVRTLSQNGYEACFWLSPKGLYHTLTAKVAICDHSLGNINQFLTGGVYYVNLWHGSSVKRVRWQAPDYFVKKYHLKNEKEMRTSFRFRMQQYQVLFRTPDLCLAPSTIQAKDFFAPMMDIPIENCVVGVFPRSQLLIAGKTATLEFVEKHEPEATLTFVKRLGDFKKTYIYMPTWRNNNADFLVASGVNWHELNEKLRKKDELLILKLHPFTKLNVKEVSEYSNLCIYPTNSDIYTILPFTDCLITDYSSIYTDFLMMNKEIILFVFDYDEYVKNSYDLAEYDKYFVGKRAYNFSQLLHIIDSEEDCHVPKEQYDFLMEFFWDNNRHQIDIVEEVKRRISF